MLFPYYTVKPPMVKNMILTAMNSTCVKVQWDPTLSYLDEGTYKILYRQTGGNLKWMVSIHVLLLVTTFLYRPVCQYFMYFEKVPVESIDQNSKNNSDDGEITCIKQQA